MSVIYKERTSDSPYVETVTRGWTVSDGSTMRPAESRWHMVFVRHGSRGGARSLVAGPWTTTQTIRMSQTE
jgi:hypothetical protein